MSVSKIFGQKGKYAWQWLGMSGQGEANCPDESLGKLVDWREICPILGFSTIEKLTWLLNATPPPGTPPSTFLKWVAEMHD